MPYGSVKTNSCCLGGMVLKRNSESNSAELTYFNSHNRRITLKNIISTNSKSIKAAISAKPALEVPVKTKNWRNVCDNFSNRHKSNDEQHQLITHAHFLQKFTISDMKQKVNYTRRLHPDDSTSTFLVVKKLHQEDFNIILVYKPQGEKTLIGPKICNNIDLKNNIFVFGFKTKEKLKMFETQAHKIVCIDGTHKTNQCKFLLINLVFPDEFNKGYPVAHLICNRQDELVLIPFFQAIIKERSSNPN